MPQCAIIVHDVDQILAVLRVATETETPVMLWSAPSAAAVLGAEVFLSMTEHAMAQVPDADVETVLHCGGDPGFALAALRQGAKRIFLEANAAGRIKVADIGRHFSAILEPSAEFTFDAGTAADYETAVRNFLEGHGHCQTPPAKSI